MSNYHVVIGFFLLLGSAGVLFILLAIVGELFDRWSER